jgi:hypothetical protein
VSTETFRRRAYYDGLLQAYDASTDTRGPSSQGLCSIPFCREPCKYQRVKAGGKRWRWCYLHAEEEAARLYRAGPSRSAADVFERELTREGVDAASVLAVVDRCKMKIVWQAGTA